MLTSYFQPNVLRFKVRQNATHKFLSLPGELLHFRPHCSVAFWFLRYTWIELCHGSFESSMILEFRGIRIIFTSLLLLC